MSERKRTLGGDMNFGVEVESGHPLKSSKGGTPSLSGTASSPQRITG